MHAFYLLTNNERICIYTHTFYLLTNKKCNLNYHTWYDSIFILKKLSNICACMSGTRERHIKIGIKLLTPDDDR